MVTSLRCGDFLGWVELVGAARSVVPAGLVGMFQEEMPVGLDFRKDN